MHIWCSQWIADKGFIFLIGMKSTLIFVKNLASFAFQFANKHGLQDCSVFWTLWLWGAMSNDYAWGSPSPSWSINIINPIPYEWGVMFFPPPPPTDIANYGVFCIENILFYYLTFHIRGYWNFVEKIIQNFLGQPPFGPLKNLKISEFSKLTPHDLL